MPSLVKTTHPDYSAMTDKWSRCRDAVSGRDAILAAGTKYLPALKDQTSEEYKAYAQRAKWFNATWRTINSLQGMIFRKEPAVEVPASVEPFLEDATLTGKSLMIFAQQVTLDVLTTGRVGVLVDYPQQTTKSMTLADAQALNLRPVLAQYGAESIINWKTERIGNATVLSLLVLTEQADLEGHQFEHKKETRYRVLDLAFRPADVRGETEGRVYCVRVFRVKKSANGVDEEDEQIGADLFPLMNGAPLPAIPFFFIGTDDTTPDVDDPPLIDLIDLNIDHFRLSADHKHGLHFTGLPTPWIAGYRPENEGDKLHIGSMTAWCFADPQAKAGYLEFTGQGLGAIAEEMAKNEEQMAVVGARILATEKKDTETAQTANIHRAGESSILSSISGTISDGLTKALRVFCEWAASPGEVSVELNREFLPPGMTPQELTAWSAAQMQGVVSPQVVFWNLQQREQVPPGMTFEEMEAQIGEHGVTRPEGEGE